MPKGKKDLEIVFTCPLGSECEEIRDNKIHRYYPDFLVKVKKGQLTETRVIEVKPSKFLKPPKAGRKKTKSYLYEVREWGRNSAKWAAAKDYCDKREWMFDVWTEKTLRM